MTKTVSLSVAFTGPDDGLQLVYLKEDNLLPSEIAAAQESAENVAAGCNAVSSGPALSEAEQNALDEALHHEDQHAWPIRKLRLYPAVSGALRCSYGEIVAQHVVQEAHDEIVVVSGSDQGTFEFRGDPSTLVPVGRCYDEAGDEIVAPNLQYRGKGMFTCDRKFWGMIRAIYDTEYRVIQLTVVPTGENFEVQCLAYAEQDVAAVVVPFELLEFDTGQVAGVNCGGGGGGTEQPVQIPPPAARYSMISFVHAPEVEMGKALVATFILRNINGVAGTGSVRFTLRYTDIQASAVFSCEANGQVQISVSVTPNMKGIFTTTGEVIGDFFTTTNGMVEVTDPASEEPEQWLEFERTMTDIDVDGVLVKRIEQVTFDKGETGKKVTLVFDNTGVM